MTDWEAVGVTLRTSRRRQVAQATHRERCDGCGTDVERTRNVLVHPDRTSGTGPDLRPVYRLDAYQALCQRCVRERADDI